MGQREDEIGSGGRAGNGGGFRDPVATRRAEMAEAVNGVEPDDAGQIRSDIEQTRAEMSETIDAISEKLSPENIKEQVMGQVGEAVQSAKDSVREATIGRVEKVMENVGDSMGRAGTAVTETGSSLVETIKQNPLPAALIGLGVGMLVMRSRDRRSRYGYDEYDGGADWGYEGARARATAARGSGQGAVVLGSAKETVADTVSSVRETAGSVATQTREQAGRLGDQARRGARRAGDQFQTQLQQNPLAVGAVAMALGAAVGLAAPSTRVENRYMGEARDTLVGKAEEAARGAMEKVQQVAQDAVGSPQGEGGHQG